MNGELKRYDPTLHLIHHSELIIQHSSFTLSTWPLQNRLPAAENHRIMIGVTCDLQVFLQDEEAEPQVLSNFDLQILEWDG